MLLFLTGIGRSRTAVGSYPAWQWVECELVVPLRKGCWLKSNTGQRAPVARELAGRDLGRPPASPRPLGVRSWAPPHSTGGSGESRQPRLTFTARRGVRGRGPAARVRVLSILHVIYSATKASTGLARCHDYATIIWFFWGETMRAIEFSPSFCLDSRLFAPCSLAARKSAN